MVNMVYMVSMTLTINTKAVPIKPKNRIWALADGSLKEAVPYDQFFFQGENECFMGTYYNTKRGGGLEDFSATILRLNLQEGSSLKLCFPVSTSL